MVLLTKSTVGKLKFFSLVSYILSISCEQDLCNTEHHTLADLKTCRVWDPNLFNEESPSIIFGKVFFPGFWYYN